MLLLIHIHGPGKWNDDIRKPIRITDGYSWEDNAVIVINLHVDSFGIRPQLVDFFHH